jgi:hypothetical protein
LYYLFFYYLVIIESSRNKKIYCFFNKKIIYVKGLILKNINLISSIALACLTTVTYADYPEVIINSDIILNYDQKIDLRPAISVPTVADLPDADISVNQFNHESPISAIGRVVNNRPSGVDGQVISEIDVEVTAVGNNASIDVSGTANPVIGAVQGNQWSSHTAIGEISGNRIDLDEDKIVNLAVTSVGNNLSIDAENSADVESIGLGSIQFNYDSPTTAIGSIVGNGFGVNARGVVPTLTVTAVGNNLSSLAPTTGSLTQINRGSPVTATGLVSRNTGKIGPINVSVTAVGNNISIKQPSTGE